MKGLRKRNTEPADTDEYFGHNEGSRQKKKKSWGGASNGDAYPSANASTEGRSREDDDHSEKMTVKQISLCISSRDTTQLGIYLIPEKMREE